MMKKCQKETERQRERERGGTKLKRERARESLRGENVKMERESER